MKIEKLGKNKAINIDKIKQRIYDGNLFYGWVTDSEETRCDEYVFSIKRTSLHDNSPFYAWENETEIVFNPEKNIWNII
jgi:hypothetical protein